MHIRAFLLLFILSSGLRSTQAINPSDVEHFTLTEECRNAYKLIISLKIREGRQLLDAELESSPNNLIPYYFLNYADFLEVYTSENMATFDAFKSNSKQRIKHLRSGNEHSPFYLYSQAEVYLQSAILKIKYTEYISGILDIRKAVKLLERNMRSYPDFIPNKKSLGLLYTVLGSVPDKYKFGLAFLGISSEMSEGMMLLDEVMEYCQEHPDYLFAEEVITTYSFLLLHLHNAHHEAWLTLMESNFPHPENLMNVFTCAHIGIFSGHTEEALDILSTKPTDTSFISFPYLDYLHGLGKLYRLDKDADLYFEKFIEQTVSEYHIKSAYQKLAWHALIQGDLNAYSERMAEVLTVGNELFDADKQAQKEAEEKIAPHPELLQARLLFDGGFLPEAKSKMLSIDLSSLEDLRYKVEYHYRLGRIHHHQGDVGKAIDQYVTTLEKGNEMEYYIVANAALQLGYIYKEQHEPEKAAFYFEKCLAIKNHAYKNGLDQKAKAGLSSLN